VNDGWAIDRADLADLAEHGGSPLSDLFMFASTTLVWFDRI
jgi:hypothetical protein